jgi:hypothetical protein
MKRVTFSDKVEVNTTWSSSCYDRHQIDSVLYRKGYNNITNSEWLNIFKWLHKYKLNEMSIHIDADTNL